MLLANKGKTDCGIVAAYNASVWCDLGLTYGKVKKKALSCGFKEEIGILFFQFAALVEKLKLPAKLVNFKSVLDLQDKIIDGNFYIFLYTATGDSVGHAMVVFLDHKGNIRIVNPEKHRATWIEFVQDIYQNGMKFFRVYEIPRRT